MMGFELQADEQILVKTRKHWIILLRDIGGTIAIGIAPFVLLGLLTLPGIIPLDNRLFLHVLAFVEVTWTLLVWLALFALWTNYYLDLWIVTNRRVVNVDQINLFRRAVTTWQFDNIQEVTTETQNPIQTFFNYGLIYIRTAGPSEKYARMEGIPQPDEVSSLMLKQMEKFRKLEETTKQQESLLHTISHEVKAHLTKNEAALASIIEGDYGSVPENLRSMAGTALSETRKGVSMVMNMLSSSDFKTGTMALETSLVDFAALVQDVYAALKKNAEGKGLAIEYAVAPGDYMIRGDGAKLRDQVIRNLVDNAIHYTPKGFVRIRLARSDRAIIFAVSDSGIGISPGDMAKLFTEGGKGTHSSEINPESTGYGLSIAKRVAEAHGGVLWAESDGADKGSTFYVSLPAAERFAGSGSAVK
ncbi:PH domain-containing protein [Candidatus Kaiserbacteria bacterium]|nr:PH domain-containing protein [Candidatus Kaiserbacteria bacterium]